jgi:hypothetical protein
VQFTFWLRWLNGGSRRNPIGRVRPRKSGSARLGLELLEDRTVPSTFTALNLADSGAGALGQGALDANATGHADVIHFSANCHTNPQGKDVGGAKWCH